MIFDEIYSIYYNTVTEIINKLARDKYILDSEIKKIAVENGILHTQDISEPFVYNEWNIAASTKECSGEGTKIVPIVNNELKFPLSTIQKRWLKSISLDPRFKLFNIEINGLEDVEPLFSAEDCFIFDKNIKTRPAEIAGRKGKRGIRENYYKFDISKPGDCI